MSDSGLDCLAKAWTVGSVIAMSACNVAVAVMDPAAVFFQVVLHPQCVTTSVT